MRVTTCPSCGHELYDKTDKCPFCGTDLPRQSIFSSTGGYSSNNRVKLMVIVSLLLVISGVAFTLFMAMRMEQTDKVQTEISEQVDYQDEFTLHCEENMHRILDAEDLYRVQYGQFTDDIDELAAFDSSLDTVCPVSGIPYSITVSKQNVHVSCSVHGDID